MRRVTTAERVSHEMSDNFVYQRSRLAYHYAAERVSGSVLEIGTGVGYGIDIIAPQVDHFVTLDKHLPRIDQEDLPRNVEMVEFAVPQLPFGHNTFDAIISLQVIEHINDDIEFIAEAYRVLKPGGFLILTTPNAPMSLTRNPWHIREYTIEEFTELLSTKFDPKKIERLGIEGNSRVKEYYEKNRKSVKSITKFDIFNLQHKLPRWMLQIPYDILNRANRKYLLSENKELTESIRITDYRVNQVSDDSFDLLYIAQK